jgi:hypothetical protein
MPLPMVHLAVAIQLGERWQNFPSSPFLLGSIAPDAIHMRPNTIRTDKDVTHLKPAEDTPDHAAVHALLDQWRLASPDAFRFAAGYAAHVLTDRLWLQDVIVRFRAHAPTQPNSEAERTLYYEETDQIDFNLYHQSDWRPEVWKRLPAAEAIDFPPLLTGQEIGGWQERTLHWYGELKQEPGILPRYLTDEMVHDFIGQATDYVEKWFELWGVETPA